MNAFIFFKMIFSLFFTNLSQLQKQCIKEFLFIDSGIIAEVFEAQLVTHPAFLSQTKDGTGVPGVGAWGLNHWTIREVPPSFMSVHISQLR